MKVVKIENSPNLGVNHHFEVIGKWGSQYVLIPVIRLDLLKLHHSGEHTPALGLISKNDKQSTPGPT